MTMIIIVSKQKGEAKRGTSIRQLPFWSPMGDHSVADSWKESHQSVTKNPDPLYCNLTLLCRAARLKSRCWLIPLTSTHLTYIPVGASQCILADTSHPSGSQNHITICTQYIYIYIYIYIYVKRGTTRSPTASWMSSSQTTLTPNPEKIFESCPVVKQ